MRRLTRSTVGAIQGMAPGAFGADAEKLVGKLECGHIFESYNEMERKRIWNRVCYLTKERTVPSLFTFFEDRKFLSAAGSLMKRLIPRGPVIAQSLRESFQDRDQKPDKCIIQLTEFTYSWVSGTAADRLDLGCRQLWLAALRAYHPSTPKRRGIRPIPRTEVSEEIVFFRLAALARRLGFDSEEIRRLLEQSPDRLIARRMLHSARDPAHYGYPNFESCLDVVEEVIRTAEERVEVD